MALPRFATGGVVVTHQKAVETLAEAPQGWATRQ